MVGTGCYKIKNILVKDEIILLLGSTSSESRGHYFRDLFKLLL